MIKYKYLVFIVIFCALLSINPICAYAQSEMDLLIEENKKNNSKTEEIDFADMLSNSIKEEEKKDISKDKQDTKNDEDIAQTADNNGTWLDFLFKKVTSKSKNENEGEDVDSFEESDDLEDFKIKSNAAYFDISKVRLRMKPSEVEEILKNQGYRKISENFEIPNFIEWRAEELCRINGVIGFERLRACAVRIAQENGHQFIEKQIYNRHTTRETIEVNYTSVFTDNVSYRIFYKSNLPMSESKNSKHVYINNIKIFDFWRRIDLKYGKPDNASEVKWGFGGKKPFLQAKTGELTLMDPLLVSLDTTRMYNEDSQMSNVQYYSF